MKCPRRVEGPFHVNDREDDTGENGTCSYCGSLLPDLAMAYFEQGALLDPTDKSYKVYIEGLDRGFTKFYFQHLSKDQMVRFIELFCDKKLNVAGGGFYVLPFFMTRIR